jgi:hypothetical protein
MGNVTDDNLNVYRRESDEHLVPDLFQYEKSLKDIHSVASTLKMYFQELPNPLCTYQLYHAFDQAVQCTEDVGRTLPHMKEQCRNCHLPTTGISVGGMLTLYSVYLTLVNEYKNLSLHSSVLFIHAVLYLFDFLKQIFSCEYLKKLAVSNSTDCHQFNLTVWPTITLGHVTFPFLISLLTTSKFGYAIHVLFSWHFSNR